MNNTTNKTILFEPALWCQPKQIDDAPTTSPSCDFCTQHKDCIKFQPYISIIHPIFATKQITMHNTIQNITSTKKPSHPCILLRENDSEKTLNFRNFKNKMRFTAKNRLSYNKLTKKIFSAGYHSDDFNT